MNLIELLFIYAGSGPQSLLGRYFFGYISLVGMLPAVILGFGLIAAKNVLNQGDQYASFFVD